MKKFFLLSISLFLFSLTWAQTTVSGIVTGGDEGALIGATVQVKGTLIGTVTDFDGNYSIQVPEGSKKLVVSYIGFATQEVEITGNVVNVELSSGELLSEIVVLGSRSTGRTKLETTAPVDVLDIKDIANNGPQTTVNEILNYVAPSFSSNKQTISDGTDHIDPASLRALGPDQVLVLINRKRRHTTSLVNVNGTFGRGNVGTDMNAIPVAAIDRIEVLRDGAAAQYGSDAIAGVINIVLKQDKGATFSIGTGAYMTSELPEADKDNGVGLANMDGESVQMSVNYGAALGEKGGFINLTGSYDQRNYTNRMKELTGRIFSGYNNPDYQGDPGDDITESELALRGLTRSDFNMRVGQSALRAGGAMMNMELPVGKNATLYAFGGVNYRRGEATGFYRLPYQSRNVIEVYPNGFLPEINSNIVDKSIAIGVRNRVGNWDVDFSNTYGSNAFDYLITNTLNASLETASPTSFNSGGFSFAQNTTNFDIRRYWDDVMSGFNLAFGSEFRLENYEITAGEEASYTNYGLATWYETLNGDSILIQDGKGPVSTIFGPDGSARPGGAQVFPGFSPNNALNVFRNSIAAYVDMEADITDAFLVGAAARFENYSDFGSTLTGKLSARYKISNNMSIRATGSTGFRAPSLHQLYFNSTSTLFVDGIPNEVGTFSNDSRPAKLLGIPQLKEETSTSVSAGITGQVPGANLTFTLDGFIVNIVDRVVLTGSFSGNQNGSAVDQEIYSLLQQANASSATFFVNAIDTKTSGIDVVLTHNAKIGSGKLRTSLAGTFSKTELGDIKTSEQLKGKESTYFDETSRIFLESSVPRTKVNLTFNYSAGKFHALLRNVYFGEVQEATNNEANAQIFAAKVVTDLSIGYQLMDNLNLTIGANNLLDVYPDMNIEANQGSGQFLYSRRSQQFGSNGRYVFARLQFAIK
ncbi:MAG: TonB-dependent receptor [Saprospiraceae bacterium]|nr:TonB-dependent receptor [Saprospiraceae bacterium]MCB9324939.1 TonB-dependent receptor [Lewinellaceae bacterium]